VEIFGGSDAFRAVSKLSSWIHGATRPSGWKELAMGRGEHYNAGDPNLVGRIGGFHQFAPCKIDIGFRKFP